jgi:deoxyribonuclease V
MWWAVDVHYVEDGPEPGARVGGVGFVSFAEESGVERALWVPGMPEAYEPGQFYRRELPLVQAFLADVRASGHAVTGVVVDGFVWLGPDRPGLGEHLFATLEDGVPVIGVAKTGFSGAQGVAEPVYRGESAKPLWVTADGIEVERAARRIEGMAGEYRMPAVLKRVDRIAREGLVE